MKQGNPGCNKLVNVLTGMSRNLNDEPLLADYGIINPDYSLQTNTFPEPIPKSEYNVCRSVTYDPGVPLTETYKDGEHTHPDASMGGAHVNQVKLPEKMYWIRPGDKVIVLWIQNEANVVDIIFRGDVVG